MLNSHLAVSGYLSITYESLHHDIERLVSMKAGLYTIPGFERDDVAQEIRLTCVRALSKYDTAKNHSTPFHFLAQCVDNRLRNLLRDNGATLPKASKDDLKAIDRASQKHRLQSALSVGDDVPEDFLGFAPNSSNVLEFAELVLRELPPDIKESFKILIQAGPPSISKKHLAVIKRAIRNLYPGII